MWCQGILEDDLSSSQFLLRNIVSDKFFMEHFLASKQTPFLFMALIYLKHLVYHFEVSCFQKFVNRKNFPSFHLICINKTKLYLQAWLQRIYFSVAPRAFQSNAKLYCKMKTKKTYFKMCLCSQVYVQISQDVQKWISFHIDCKYFCFIIYDFLL